MAPGTVDQRLLTKSSRRASAGVLLALAVAVLLLAGCGGGSSDPTSSAATTSAAAGEASGGRGSGSGSGTDAGATAANDESEGDAGAAGGSATPDGQASSGGRHGPPVPQPTGPPEPKITPKQRREATVASMILQSPAGQPSAGGTQALPAAYTCDGKNTSPPLRWAGVPEGTAELVLFAMNLQPVDGKLFFDWAVAGLSPDLDELEAGRLPRGAIAGRNGFGKTGYGICPEGQGETYMFALFALPEKLSPSPGFEPLALRKEVLDVSGNAGILAFTYARG